MKENGNEILEKNGTWIIILSNGKKMEQQK